jgi:hypothetical protein
MFRAIVGCAVLAVAFCCFTSADAKEYKDVRITKIDGDTVTVKIGDDEKTFTLGDKATIKRGDNTLDKEKLGKVLEKAKKGISATIETEEKDDKEVEKDGKKVLKSITLKGKKN